MRSRRPREASADALAEESNREVERRGIEPPLVGPGDDEVVDSMESAKPKDERARITNPIDGAPPIRNVRP
jgi:hypothetical protein